MMSSIDILQQALDVLDEKAAFLEANERVPELVRTESSPEAFLQCEGGHAQKAAQRLAKYWTERKSIFKERAFLPMNPSGEGALTKEDIEMLESGLMVALPRDEDGRPVTFHDASRMSLCLANEASRHRVRFYFLNRIAMDTAAQEKGVVMMRVMGLTVPGAAVASIRKQVQECLPMNIHALHFLCVESNPETQKHILSRVIPVVVQGLGKELSARMKVHIGKDPDQVFEKLERCGFDRTAVPSTVGGTWSYAHLDAWRLRKQNKQSLTESPSTHPTPLQAIPPLLQFVLGVLVMLQEQRKSSLTTMLQDEKIQRILQGLLGQKACAESEDVTRTEDVIAECQEPTATRKRKRKISAQEDDRDETVLEQIALLRAENKRLASEIETKLPATPIETNGVASLLPTQVQFALGVLACLEHKQQCTLRSLLGDLNVQRILRGLLGTA